MPLLSSIQLLSNFSTGSNAPIDEFPATVEYLLVGGGGGGGSSARYWVNTYYEASGGGGGGGAGGLLQGNDLHIPLNFRVDITVGAGGAGGVSYMPVNGYAGSNTTLNGLSIITAYGGGYGAKGSVYVSSPLFAQAIAGGAGASGGGATSSSATTGAFGGSAITGQGFAGGSARKVIVWSTPGWYGGAGGGGAGGAGGAAHTSSNGTPGTGVYSSISGSSTMYAMGGEGGYSSTSYSASYHVAGYGYGGPGARSTNGTATGAYYGGGGGAGVVYIRYPRQYLSATVTGTATETISGNYKVYKVTQGSGSIEFQTASKGQLYSTPDSGISYAFRKTLSFTDKSFAAFGGIPSGEYTIPAVSVIDATGVITTSKQINTGNNYDILLSDMCKDSNNNVYVGVTEASSVTPVGALLVKYSYTGEITWQKFITHPTYNLALRAVGTDGSDNFYAVLTLSSSNNTILVIKFNSSGSLLWQKQIIGLDPYTIPDSMTFYSKTWPVIMCTDINSLSQFGSLHITLDINGNVYRYTKSVDGNYYAPPVRLAVADGTDWGYLVRRVNSGDFSGNWYGVISKVSPLYTTTYWVNKLYIAGTDLTMLDAASDSTYIYCLCNISTAFYYVVLNQTDGSIVTSKAISVSINSIPLTYYGTGTLCIDNQFAYIISGTNTFKILKNVPDNAVYTNGTIQITLEDTVGVISEVSSLIYSYTSTVTSSNINTLVYTDSTFTSTDTGVTNTVVPFE